MHFLSADHFYVEVKVIPSKNHWGKYLIGPGGARVKEIAALVEQELMNLFHCDLKFSLGVKSNKK
jgi:GTPase Era involved in 16S rRNA processing